MNFKIQVDSVKNKVEDCLDIKFSDSQCLGLVEVIHDELKNISNFVKINAGSDYFFSLNNEFLINNLIHLIELVFKLCEKFTSQKVFNNDEILKMLKLVFKINFDLEMTIVKMVEDMKPNIFDDNKCFITELSSSLSACAVVAEKLEMKAGYPLWKILKIITSSYCGTFIRAATDKCYFELLNNFRESFWFRYDSWLKKIQENSNFSQDQLMKELKMSSFLMKCFLTFVTSYEIILLENQQIMTQVVQLAFEIIEKKLELVITNQNAYQLNQSYDDSIMYGCEIIASLLLKHYQINELVTPIQEYSNGRFMISTLFFGYLMKAVTYKNEPEQSSLYIQEICQTVIDNLSKIKLSSKDDYEKFNHVYKQIYTQTACLICIHRSTEIIYIESILWDNIFQCNILHVWVYLTDVIVFLSRYAPITILCHYCDFLCKLIPEIVTNNFPINFIMMIGNLYTRLIGFSTNRDQILNKSHPISTQYFYPWKLCDDINGVINSISNVIMEFFSLLKDDKIIKLSKIYEVLFSVLLLEKLKNLGHKLVGIEENIFMVWECIELLSNTEKGQEIKQVTIILGGIINQYQPNQKLPIKRKSPLNEENSIIKKQKIVIDELEISSVKLCSLVENEGLILDNACMSKLHKIVSAISNLL